MPEQGVGLVTNSFLTLLTYAGIGLGLGIGMYYLGDSLDTIEPADYYKGEKDKKNKKKK